ncbi:phosphorothioated DNA-binding restriction endonuclease [Streptomyces paludis]|uniref:Restriction endonuclease n=1 Tax=Streptomyces paludis TaxID=2282738 RepID=A0A345HS90_9ACTN|nr:HNH endonuclease [Streptomyces paludis]AXG79564.1 restriction endonuclease [Streptomyces paludis]
MKRDELNRELAGLRRARIGDRRAPHKPLLLLWLLGRFAASGGTPGGTAVTYDEAEEPVSRLINDFGPAVTSPARARERAAMPFVHLERSLWDLRDATGQAIGTDAPERGGQLRARGAHGRLRPEVEALVADPAVLAAAARQLLEQHFTPALEALVRDAAGLDLPGLDEEMYAAVPPLSDPSGRSAPSGLSGLSRPARRARRAGFAEEVLHAYAYACAFCGFDGALGRHPVGLEAAHVRWHSQDGPDAVDNGLALCSLHHTLLDLGVLGLVPGPSAGPRIQVSRLYVTRSEAGRAVDALHGRPVAPTRPGHPPVSKEFVVWHGRQVFKRPGAAVM